MIVCQYLITVSLFFFTAHALRCYTDAEATQITRCKESEGFRTCFTKYNDSKFDIYYNTVYIYLVYTTIIYVYYLYTNIVHNNNNMNILNQNTLEPNFSY